MPSNKITGINPDIFCSWKSVIKKEMRSQVLPLVRLSKIILDSGFHALDSLSLDFGFLVSGTWIADSSSVELGFRIPIVSWIPDSLS